MPEAVEPPQGLMVECGLIEADINRAADSFSITGECFECQYPVKAWKCHGHLTAQKIVLEYVCRHCGYVNRLVEANVSMIRCEPSLNPART